MPSEHLKNLFSPIQMGGCTINNRIVFTGHHTYLADRVPGDQLVAYLEDRAQAGVGLIVSEIVAVHASAGFASNLLVADSEKDIPHYRRLVEACQSHGSRMFAQLFHPGREILSAYSGMAPVAWAPSSVPNERFHIMPRELSQSMIEEIIKGFGTAASLLSEAGFDGFEIVASHGYLPAQFLNPQVNLRDDEYGGNLAGRLLFLEKVISEVRRHATGKVIGLRISAAELGCDGMEQAQMSEICRTIAPQLDYISVVAGTSSSLGGSVHIVPPMGIENNYIAPFSRTIKQASGLPIMATGRINQPQDAEQIIVRGDADLCGMTRAMICDSKMAAKARSGDFDNIRHCIGCNQSCIGRAHRGLPISCIQHPESGRELEYGNLPDIDKPKNILVAGGGVAGIKAATIAAKRGHHVTLLERNNGLGGQVNMAMKLPGRSDFGGMISNLKREMRQQGVEVKINSHVDLELIRSMHRESSIDDVIIATGAFPYRPPIDGIDQDNVYSAWQVIDAKVNIGQRVVITDWKADWIGIGLAEMLATAGSEVILCVNAAMAGETLQIYTRNHYLGRIRKLGVTIHTHLRLFGIDDDTVYFQDVLTDEPVVMEQIDSLVLSLGHHSNNTLEKSLLAEDIDFHVIGDSLAPRTAEEAVYEGLVIGCRI